MKQFLFNIILLFLSCHSMAQSMRYFAFRTDCGHGNWQDTQFIAATSDTAVIDTVLAHLAKPAAQRSFISGKITGGSGGYNRNASHEFKWHFIPNEWALVEAAIEVCDGCPYSDVDSDTSYWLSTIGIFCPWSGIPVADVTSMIGLEELNSDLDITIFPNPTRGNIEICGSDLFRPANVEIIDPQGRIIKQTGIQNAGKGQILLPAHPGVYWLKLYTEDGNSLIRKVIRF